MGIGFSSDDAAADTVGTGALENGAVTTAKIATGAVTTDRIADAAVTAAKLALGAITSDQLGTDSVGADEIIAGAVGTSELANLGVTEGKIAANAVTSGKIAADAVGSSHIANGSVGTDEIATGGVGTDELATDAVTNAKLADNAVDTGQIVDACITSAKFAPGAVGAASLTDNAVTAVKIAVAQSFSANGNILATGGPQVRYTGSTASQTLTLPAAASGLEFGIANLATVPVTIDGNGAEYIGHASTASIVLAPGARVTLIASGTGSWYPVWDLGEQVSGGYAEASTDSSGVGDKLSCAVVGDGVTPMLVEFEGHIGSVGASAGATVQVQIRDGSGGGGTLFRKGWFNVSGSSTATLVRPSVVVAPFTGSKTFYAYMPAAGSGTAIEYAGTVGSKRSLRATWAPGQYTANP